MNKEIREAECQGKKCNLAKWQSLIILAMFDGFFALMSDAGYLPASM